MKRGRKNIRITIVIELSDMHQHILLFVRTEHDDLKERFCLLLYIYRTRTKQFLAGEVYPKYFL